MRNSGLVLFACSGLLLSGGTILAGSTVMNLIRVSYFFWISDLGAELASGLMMVSGALLCLPACWLATIVPYHPRSYSLPATLMALVVAALVLLSTGMLATMSLSRSLHDTPAINASLQQAMSREPHDITVRNAFSAMQLELQCCGVESHIDWRRHREGLPQSCCGRTSKGKLKPLKSNEPCHIPLHQSGCLRPAVAELRAYVTSLTILGYCLIIVLTMTLFTSSYLVVTSIPARFSGVSGYPSFVQSSCAQHLANAPIQPPLPIYPTTR